MNKLLILTVLLLPSAFLIGCGKQANIPAPSAPVVSQSTNASASPKPVVPDVASTSLSNDTEKMKVADSSSANVSASSSTGDGIDDEDDNKTRLTVDSLNGQTLSCDVHSDEAGNTYSLDVEFEGDTARINFLSGGYKYVDIDDPDGTDLTEIDCTDHEGRTWTISVDSPPDVPETDNEPEE